MIHSVLLCVLCAAFSHEVLFEEIHSQKHGYTLKLTNGWKVMPENQLQALQGKTVKYDYGINSDNPDDPFTYILLRTIPERVSNFTFDQIEKMLEREMNLKLAKKEIEKENLQDVIHDVQLGTAVLDRKKKQIVFQIDMDIMGAVKLRCLGFGMIANDGITYIYCYSPKETFKDRLAGFYKVADGFFFEANRTYVEPSGGPLGNVINSSINGGLIGGIIGGLVVAVLAIVKKLKRSSSTTSQDEVN
jgi:hypothetical protein